MTVASCARVLLSRGREGIPHGPAGQQIGMKVAPYPLPTALLSRDHEKV